MPILVAVPSKARLCSRRIAGIAVSSAGGNMDIRLSCLLCVVQAALSATS